MTPPAPREILLVHRADSPAASDACARAAGVLRTGGFQPVTLCAGSADDLSRDLTAHVRARALRTVAVVAVGGDGMVHLVLQCLHALAQRGVELPFGLVPAGSGNDLARHAGLPTRDPERAAGRVLRGLDRAPRSMDLVDVRCADGSEHVCATAVCLGLDARVNARANEWSRIRTSAKYAAALALEVVSLRARRYDLSWTAVDGTGHAADRMLTFLTFANTSSIGGGLTITPQASATDGAADLFTVSDVGILRFLRCVPRLWLRTHEALPEVHVERAVSATVALDGTGSAPARDAAYGDGERLGPLPVSLTVVPGALRVLF